ncbi:2-dehydropantoate 2-reductase [Myroides gitamensis]|uniref:ketopantoate reductase family protein n=1 Tax=Myroides odoratus TaxID=256 RepID=UPI002168C638|nr:2-dehydropantoate 2-reductase [Myroides odoratus]MCS4238694.1 2-dehydropantoate 2-reductase [Myroides odoratus]MDH6600371.1 2-dehydropantoate 2-reductase [Myroides gitamensis]
MAKKVLIVGIGGVGGYFGGLLAKQFYDNKNVSICFMVRGDNLEAIKQNGLLVIKDESRFTTYPTIASDNPLDFQEVDYIILCTKSYDIEQTVEKLRSCVKADTVFLPLLNGVDSVEKIKKMYPHNLVADGCAYIISRLVAPGQVENLGNNQSITFGLQDLEDARLNFLHKLFNDAGIESILTTDIAAKIWEKFIFISAIATITSYYNITFGEIKKSEVYCNDLFQLVDECNLIAKQKNINLSTDIKERIWQNFIALSPEATTSMHADYLAGKPITEVHSLTGYVVKQAQLFNCQLVKYPMMYKKLIKK